MAHRYRKARVEGGKVVPLEDQIQAQLVLELESKIRREVFFTAIPNGDLRKWSVAIRLKAQGVKPGVTDILFVAPKSVVAFLEIKRPIRSSVLSDAQLGFKAMCERNEHLWAMARTVEEALGIVGRWGFLKAGA